MLLGALESQLRQDQIDRQYHEIPQHCRNQRSRCALSDSVIDICTIYAQHSLDALRKLTAATPHRHKVPYLAAQTFPCGPAATRIRYWQRLCPVWDFCASYSVLRCRMSTACIAYLLRTWLCNHRSNSSRLCHHRFRCPSPSLRQVWQSWVKCKNGRHPCVAGWLCRSVLVMSVSSQNAVRCGASLTLSSEANHCCSKFQRSSTTFGVTWWYETEG